MSEPRPVAVIVLAAGEGTRMKSRIPKVLHSLCGRSMLGHALAAAGELDPQRVVVVVGHRRDEVSAEAARHVPDVCVVVQERLAGTGHAVRMVTEALGVMPGIVVVTYGDMPLLRARTLAALVREHAAAANAVTVLTARVPDPSGYGRIIRDDDGSLAEIVEEADATAAQRAIDEINSGCYAFDGALLADAVKRVATSNAQGQEYLTDVVAILRGDGHPAGTVAGRRPGRGPGRERPGSARQGAPRLQRAAARDVDAGRGHDRGPRRDLDRRRCHPGPGCGNPAGDAPGGAYGGGIRSPDRPGLPAQGHIGRARREGSLRGLRVGRDRPRRRRRSVRPAAARHPDRPGGAYRDQCGTEERDGRRRLQGAAPDLRGGCRHRRAFQHRRGHGLRELRRDREASVDSGRPRADRRRQHAGRSRGDRGWRLHGRRVGDHRGRSPGSARGRPR